MARVIALAAATVLSAGPGRPEGLHYETAHAATVVQAFRPAAAVVQAFRPAAAVVVKSARTIRIDLRFLGESRYDALLVRDKPDDPAAVTIENATMTRSGTLTVDLRAGGGFIARLTADRTTVK